MTVVDTPEMPGEDAWLDELTDEALAADPDAVAPDSAIPFAWMIGDECGGDSLLPEWYMPPTASSVHLTGWRRRVAWLLVATFIAIVTSGLCSTNGILEIA
ncbi:MAG TPA: hypothetical protein VMW08_16250 [Acidimicrobiales bacterium]|nr:hypothetical protein [Acidimicrobiales bacterium]